LLLFALALASTLAAPLGAQPEAPEDGPDGYDRLGAPVHLGDLQGGSLLLATEVDGVFLPAPGLETEVTVRVSGLIARTELRQRFHNPTSAWVEGVYVFPLPEGAAVDGLEMHVGDRVIEGRVKEREEAAEVYRQAVSEGRRASLVEQERPNLFTTSVANLGPDEEMQVVLHYQQELRYDSGRFALRLPLVAAPRYVPGPGGGGPRTVGALGPAGTGPINPVTVTVELDAGFAVDRLGSASHVLDVVRAPRRPGVETRRAYPVYEITLADGPAPADRDFVLEWAPAIGREPGAASFTEELGGDTYALLMVMPPAVRRSPAEAPPREAIFVIDTSGSMHGESMEQARAALRFALGRLRPQDRFNVVRFDSTATRLFDRGLPAGDQALHEAYDFVDGLQADGGTEMLPALELAFEGPALPGAVRQVVFITDGAVGNEAELLEHVRRHAGESRLFTVGIGSAPNSHFMRGAAEEGRGTFTYVGRIEDVGPMMEELFTKLESPVLTGIEVDWGGGGAEVETWPARLPDLYAGEPIVVAARLPPGSAARAGEVVLSGRLDGRQWRVARSLAAGEPHPGVARLWARRKIGALTAPGNDERPFGERRREVVELALRHHLVTPYTSLVAVDVTPARPAGEPMRSRRLPVSLPAGWSAEHAVGTLPQGGTASRLLLLAGLALLLLAATAAAIARRTARSAP
jgi:Ca-activated chloride channel family protein